MPPRREGTGCILTSEQQMMFVLSFPKHTREGGEVVRRRVPFKLSSGLAQVICVSGSQLLRRQTETIILFWESMWTWHGTIYHLSLNSMQS